MEKTELVEDLRKEILKLRDERIRLDAELKAKAELLRRLESDVTVYTPSKTRPSPYPSTKLTWSEAILTCIKDLGGRASLRQIYSAIPQHIDLTKDHRKETRWGRRPAYQHQVRSYIANLVNEDALRSVSRGVYELTTKGEAVLSKTSRVVEEAQFLALTEQSDPVLAELWSNQQDDAYDRL